MTYIFETHKPRGVAAGNTRAAQPIMAAGLPHHNRYDDHSNNRPEGVLPTGPNWFSAFGRAFLTSFAPAVTPVTPQPAPCVLYTFHTAAFDTPCQGRCVDGMVLKRPVTPLGAFDFETSAEMRGFHV